MNGSGLKPADKASTPAQIAMRRAFAASRRIPNAPSPQHKARIHAWAEFVKAAMGKGNADQSV